MTKAHAGRDPAAPPAGLSWRGPERLIARPLVLLPALAGAGGALWMWQSGNVNESVLLVTVGVLAVAVIVAAFVLRGSPLFYGRLQVADDGLVLSHSLGLRRRRLHRVDRVEAGSAYRVDTIGSSSSGSGGQRVEEKAGIYLRLYDGRRHITVRCKENTSFRKTWTGWGQASRSRRWHITLQPADFVVLQYLLLAMGVLTLRTP